ncbi:MAG: T9SS type A sorting domain-containing protein [bacterium]
MNKTLLLSICLLMGLNLVRAQDHLLITEFAIEPTVGEFVEIYNPTDASIDLSNYFLTDATFPGGNQYYYNTVTGLTAVGGGGGGTFADFNARFPAGATIGPNEFQTIALNGSANFTTTYGVPPTYELYEDGSAADAIPDMLEATTGSINRQGGLSNDGEVLVLFYWDGQSDLVQDVDYAVWGDKVEAVSKTGVSIDGPDADTTPSTYLTDTAIPQQFVVNADNDTDANPHDLGSTAQRKLDVEDIETWTGGNGLTGHDETSENTSWKGGIWSINAPATPGWRALGDSVNIADYQFLRAEDVGMLANDDSPFNNDTLAVTGVVMHSTRAIFLGARWGAFIQDERGGPWSGYFVVQNDSNVAGTLLSAAQPGDKIRITGQLQEFPINPNTPSITQSVLFTDPIVPIEFVDFGLTPPAPIILKPGDLGATGAAEDPRLTERWESTLVRFENLTVTQNFAGQPGNVMTAGDETGTISIDDYFLGLRQYLDANQGVWPNLPAGTRVNVIGFVRDVLTGGAGRTTINPRSLADIEVASSPPAITAVTRNPVAVTSANDVQVSANIVDAQGPIARASINFITDNGPVQRVPMTTMDNTVFSGTIPRQADGVFVQYFITAVDGTNDSTDAANAQRYFYYVRDIGLTIFDVQYTPFANGNSGYNGLAVTVEGVATTDSADFGYYYIQNGRDPWNGIWINDTQTNVKLGDRVRVTGTVQENFNVTRLGNVSNATVLGSGNAVPEPIIVTTGELRTGTTAEQYEGMLVRILGARVTNPFPDGASNFGEFSINDGSGELRVDDESGGFIGNLDSSYALGDSIVSITGIHYFSFSNYKLLPRNNNDVVRFSVGVEERPGNLPQIFALDQNYPNPFNPETTIRYQLAQKGQVTITIFNMLGQKVKTLVDENKPAGSHRVVWNGRDEHGLAVPTGMYFYRMKSGDFAQVRKLLLLK